MRNIKTALDATKREGGHAQVAIAYTLSDFHTIDYFGEASKTN